MASARGQQADALDRAGSARRHRLDPTVSTRGTLQRVDVQAAPGVLVSDLVEVVLPDTDDLAVLVGLHQLWLPVSGHGLLTLSISTARVDEHEEHRELTILLGEHLSYRMSP